MLLESFLLGIEIRFGNWFHHKDHWSYRQPDQDYKEFDFQWMPEDWYAVGECRLDFDVVSPIELTEEWLIKFAFTPNIISYYKDISYFPNRVYKTLCVMGGSGISIREGEIDSPRENDVIVTLWNTDVHGPIHVHSLQNLWHSLTGRELELTK